MRVRFTKTARDEFKAVLTYLRKENPAAAKNFRDRVEKSLKRLEDFPDSGRHLPEFPELDYREVIVTPYRFFYKVVANTVWVVAVWHAARLPSPP